MLLQEAEQGVTLGAVLMRYVDFLAYFPIFGALGFYFIVLRNTRRSQAGRSESAVATLNNAESRAATIAWIGTQFFWLTLLQRVIERSVDKNLPFLEGASSLGTRFMVMVACGVAFELGFLVAIKRIKAAWVIAGIAGIVLALRNSTTGRWTSMVNPLHEVAASLWIGTLLVVMIAGIVLAMKRIPSGSDQEEVVYELVSNFSPLALSAAALLVTTGVITAWRHLGSVSALWSSAYGNALLVKLFFVACVVMMGWWNWKRVTPQLGVEGGAVAIRRSAKRELMFAGLVLLTTGVLLSLPAPSEAKRGQGPPPGQVKQ